MWLVFSFGRMIVVPWFMTLASVAGVAAAIVQGGFGAWVGATLMAAASLATFRTIAIVDGEVVARGLFSRRVIPREEASLVFRTRVSQGFHHVNLELSGGQGAAPFGLLGRSGVNATKAFARVSRDAALLEQSLGLRRDQGQSDQVEAELTAATSAAQESVGNVARLNLIMLGVAVLISVAMLVAWLVANR